MELVDLSQEIYQGMPVYPGHLKTVIWQHASHEETARNFEGGFSFRLSGLLMSDHGPTHVDAVAHLDPREGAPTIDAMPLDTFYGPATCIDVSHKAAHEYVSAAELEAAEAAAGTRAGDRRQAARPLLRPGDVHRRAPKGGARVRLGRRARSGRGGRGHARRAGHDPAHPHRRGRPLRWHAAVHEPVPGAGRVGGRMA